MLIHCVYQVNFDYKWPFKSSTRYVPELNLPWYQPDSRWLLVFRTPTSGWAFQEVSGSSRPCWSWSAREKIHNIYSITPLEKTLIIWMKSGRETNHVYKLFTSGLSCFLLRRHNCPRVSQFTLQFSLRNWFPLKLINLVILLKTT